MCFLGSLFSRFCQTCNLFGRFTGFTAGCTRFINLMAQKMDFIFHISCIHVKHDETFAELSLV